VREGDVREGDVREGDVRRATRRRDSRRRNRTFVFLASSRSNELAPQIASAAVAVPSNAAPPRVTAFATVCYRSARRD
jgi:hypothetical protein